MQVSESLSKEIIEIADQEKINSAKKYISDGKVSIIKADYKDANNFSITSIVGDDAEEYEVNIDVQKNELEILSCECTEFETYYTSCKHIVATLMKFEQTKFWDNDYNDIENKVKNKKNNKFKYKNFNNLVNSFYNEELDEKKESKVDNLSKDKVKLEAKIIYDKFSTGLKLEFKIGNKRMYKIKDLPEFYTRMVNNEFFKYGEKLEFVHNRESFEEDDKPLLDFILRYAEIMKNSIQTDRYGYYYNQSLNQSIITLGVSTIDEVFDLLKTRKVSFDYEYMSTKMTFIEGNPNVEFDLSKINDEELTLRPNIDVFKIAIFDGKKYKYILNNTVLYRCDEDFSNSSLKIIKAFRENYTSEIFLRNTDLIDFYSIIMPKIEKSVKIQGMLEDEIEKYKPEKLTVKVFLDFDENNFLTLDARFCYKEEEFNPLNENIQIEALRNTLEENKSLNVFKKTGFMLDIKNSRFILPNDEKIYNFLQNEIDIYMQKFEVLVTEKFKLKEIKEPKIGNIGVKIENNLLNIDLSKINISPEEIEDVMEKYRLKKKFYRLKDGSFINLIENQDIDLLDKLLSGMELEYKDLNKQNIKLPVNRILYLNELLKKFNNGVSIEDDKYEEIVNNFDKNNLNKNFPFSKKMENILRTYQKNGVTWLKMLDSYGFGGILADDMGLGKTIQILTIILDYVENSNNPKSSIVISPSSLTLNWLNEAKKFTPELKVKVVLGRAFEREEIIENIDKYDLIITSYDLLKRDIEFYKRLDYKFKYIIADEAQYLKNSTTQNAKSIKELNAETRFALTGTPIENSLAELWSIFDFIMPGYLFQYKKFKSKYEIPIVKDEDLNAMDKLKMLIEPFILRRTKKEVLTELPEKTITVLNSTMDGEQEKIYMTYLMKAKQEISDQININGFEKSQMAILAALTRLRQICCHPSLFLSDYKGESSKLGQCIEIVEDAVSSGHKILLFSGYTSMFELIEKELLKKDIKYFKLTGSTKVADRITLVDEFNTNPNIKVFLISLKAGGTGLNLTGADMVIHYDPWWNISSENQATDRAYRIGQKKNVQVYKLITSNSIEEKIYELQNKKSKLIDSVLSTKTTFINKFSKEEIMRLFE